MSAPELADATEAAQAAQDALARRDEVIRTLHATGRYSLRQIAAAVDLTHPGVKKIIDREATMTVTTSTPTGVYRIHTADLEEGAYAYINHGGYTGEQQTAIVGQLMAELRTAVDAALPEGWSWQPGADEILRPVDSEYDDVDVAEIFTEAAEAVYARYEEIEAAALA